MEVDGAEVRGWIESWARFGHMARGVVYVLVGLLALGKALGTGGETTGAKGAVNEIGQFSGPLLWAIAIGIAGYATWRFVEAFADPEHLGRDLRGLRKRAARLGSGLAYTAIAFAAVATALDGGDAGAAAGTAAEERKARGWSAALLAWPFGRWLLVAVGIAFLAAGVVQLYRGWAKTFERYLRLGELSERERRWAVRAGRFGIVARGFVFFLMGIFLVQAALRYDPSRAHGFGGTMRELEQQPYGPAMLALVALGLIAFGVYSFVEARYRRIKA